MSRTALQASHVCQSPGHCFSLLVTYYLSLVIACQNMTMSSESTYSTEAIVAITLGIPTLLLTLLIVWLKLQGKSRARRNEDVSVEQGLSVRLRSSSGLNRTGLLSTSSPAMQLVARPQPTLGRPDTYHYSYSSSRISHPVEIDNTGEPSSALLLAPGIHELPCSLPESLMLATQRLDISRDRCQGLL